VREREREKERERERERGEYVCGDVSCDFDLFSLLLLLEGSKKEREGNQMWLAGSIRLATPLNRRRRGRGGGEEVFMREKEREEKTER
jgi:hypothetical protein